MLRSEGTEVLGYHQQQQTQTLTAFVTFLHWSLIVKGQEDGIELVTRPDMKQVSKEGMKLRGPRAAPPVKKDTKETAEIKAAAADAASTVKKMVTIMTGVAKKTTGGAEKRGELIEQNPGRATLSHFYFLLCKNR